MLPLRNCAIALGILLAASVHAQQSQVPNSAHLQAIQQLLKATVFAELAIAGFKNRIAEEKDPVQARFLAGFADDITADEIVEKAAPIYLKYITQQHAIEVTRFYRTAVGRKMTGGMLKDAAAGRPVSFDKTQFTSTELKELDAFAITAAARAWQMASTLAAGESREMFVKLGMEVTSRQTRRAANRLADQIESGDSKSRLERGQSGAAHEGKSAAGNSIPDTYVGVMIDYGKRMSDLNRSFESAIKEIGIAAVLAPANLVTKAGIEEGQRKIAAIGERLDGHLKSVTEVTDAMRRQILEIPAPEKFRQGFMSEFEKGMADVYDLHLRAGENQRNLLDLMRRILALAESRLGSIAYQGDRLIFNDTSDLETYRTLTGQLNIEVKREQDLKREAAEARQHAIAELRNPKQPEIQPVVSGGDPAASSATNSYRPSSSRDSKVTDSFARNDYRLSYKFGSTESGYISEVKEKVLHYWVTPINTPAGLNCTVSVVQDSNGTVKNARVTKCDGGDALKRSIERAVIDASPLPLPKPGESFKPIFELTFVTDGSTSGEKVFLPEVQIQKSPSGYAGAPDATKTVSQTVLPDEGTRTVAANESNETQIDENSKSRIVSNYATQIRAKIIRFIVLPPGTPADTEVVYDVTLLPDGTILGIQKIGGTGHAGYEASVLRAIQKAVPLPVPEDYELFKKFRVTRLTFRPGGPQDQNAPPINISSSISMAPSAKDGSQAVHDQFYYPAGELEVYPRPLKEVRLDYPDAAAAKRIDGQVSVLLLIDESGVVNNASVVKAAPAGLFEETTLKTFRSVKFSPAKKQGKPVKSRVMIQVTYRYDTRQGNLLQSAQGAAQIDSGGSQSTAQNRSVSSIRQDRTNAGPPAGATLDDLKDLLPQK